MSQKRIDMDELGALLENDESSGHRLAAFLMKKNGVKQRRRHVFIDNMPNRVSLNVDLAKFKVPSSQEQQQEPEQNGRPICSQSNSLHDNTLIAGETLKNAPQEKVATSQLNDNQLLEAIETNKQLDIERRRTSLFWQSPITFLPNVNSTPIMCRKSIANATQTSPKTLEAHEEPAGQEQNNKDKAEGSQILSLLSKLKTVLNKTNEVMQNSTEKNETDENREKNANRKRKSADIVEKSAGNFTYICEKRKTTSCISEKLVISQESARESNRNVPPNTQELLAAAKQILSSPDNPIVCKETIVADPPFTVIYPMQPNASSIKLKKNNDNNERPATTSGKLLAESTDAINLVTPCANVTKANYNYGVPAAHALNLGRKRKTKRSLKKIPLNKAPRTPINGEKFAHELKQHLARMTNREILDLRKRKSLSLLFHNASDRELEQMEFELEREVQNRELDCLMEQQRIETPLPASQSRVRETSLKQASNKDKQLAERSRASKNSSKSNVSEPVETASILPDNVLPTIVSPDLTAADNVRNDSIVLDNLPADNDVHDEFPPDDAAPDNTDDAVPDNTDDAAPDNTDDAAPDNTDDAASDNAPPEDAAPNMSPSDNVAIEFQSSTPPPLFNTPLSTKVPPPPFPFNNSYSSRRVTNLTSNSIPVTTEEGTQSTAHEELSGPGSELRVNYQRNETRICNEPNNEMTKKYLKTSPKINELKRLRLKKSKRSLYTSPSLTSENDSPRSSRRTTLVLPPPVAFEDTCEINQEQHVDKDKSIFKKPLVPKPRGRKKKEIPAEIITAPSEQTPALRRSKRAHVPFVDNKVRMLGALLNLLEEKNLSKKSNESKASRKNASTPFSVLGDTNANSTTCSGVSISRAVLRTMGSAKPLSPILEPPRTKKLLKTNENLPSNSKKTKTNNIIKNKAKTSKKNKKQNDEEEEVLPIETLNSDLNVNKMPLNGSCVEHSRLNFSFTPVNNLNSLFDQLKHDDESVQAAKELPSRAAEVNALPCDAGIAKCRPFRIRLQRLNENEINAMKKDIKRQKNRKQKMKTSSKKSVENTATKEQVNEEAAFTATVSSTQDLAEKDRNIQDHYSQLLVWLKGVCVPELATVNPLLFNDMRCSAPSNLLFTNLDGLEYAFYDTEDKYSLGYLRFKPWQVKSAKRAKKYHLHFVVLSGKFNIYTDKDKGVFETGYMVAINIGARYKIENITNDIGLMMVMKLK